MARTGRPERYPWDEWLDGEDKLLMRGRGFGDIDRTHYPAGVKASSLRQQIRVKARQREIDVSVEAVNETDIGLRFSAPMRSAYDWDRLLDGEEHYLYLGEEVRTSVHVFRQVAYKAAKRRGLGVTVNQRGQILAVRAVLGDGLASEPPAEVVAASAAEASHNAQTFGGIVTGPRPVYDPLEGE